MDFTRSGIMKVLGGFLGFCISVFNPVFANELSETRLFCQYKDAFKQHACLIEHAVQGINYSLNNTLSRNEMDIYRALEAMNLIQNIAGSGRYNYLTLTSEKSVALSMNEQSLMLKRGYGICGNHQVMFLQIMELLKVKARPVDFYYTDINGQSCNHAAAEVKIGKKWRYFDITWGSIWVKEKNNLSTLLSLEDVLDKKGKRMSGLNSWYLHFTYPRLVGDPLEYLTAKPLQILRNKGGLLTVPVVNNQAAFDGLPKYIGKTSSSSPLSMKFKDIPHSMEAIIDVQGKGGLCTKSAIETASGHYAIQLGKSLIQVAPGSELAIKGDDAYCYAVINNVEFIPDRDSYLQAKPLSYAALKLMAYVNDYAYKPTRSG
ncbi:transglutaminase domain-containing protein [Legionella taurinensis]|nr:transglutaminase domain-containing protein [Legionella taurinensis]MDX1837990.1 transglutaminase domain-containing protein [Legionella taurinensis]STY25813.1 Uncharacterised protein [Legionella taurinensis]